PGDAAVGERDLGVAAAVVVVVVVLRHLGGGRSARRARRLHAGQLLRLVDVLLRRRAADARELLQPVQRAVHTAVGGLRLVFLVVLIVVVARDPHRGQLLVPDALDLVDVADHRLAALRLGRPALGLALARRRQPGRDRRLRLFAGLLLGLGRLLG